MKRNQVFTYVKDKYGTLPEHLFQKYPDIAVLRNTSTKKWYGVMMHIPQNKIGLAGNQKIDVLVIKGNPDNIVHLVEMEGFAPAYHMNKKHWLSVILDHFTANNEMVVFNLLDESYQLSGK